MQAPKKVFKEKERKEQKEKSSSSKRYLRGN